MPREEAENPCKDNAEIDETRGAGVNGGETNKGRDQAGDAAPSWEDRSKPAAVFRLGTSCERTFRWLWLGMFISWTGPWGGRFAPTGGLVDAPNAPALASLVQVVTTLPLMLLAIPVGVPADSLDRRWILITVQAYLCVLGICSPSSPPSDICPCPELGFTFALGAGAGLQLPAWEATMPELVPRTQLRAATRLDLVSVNGARSIGPALAGLVIAHLGGVPVVFALYAVCVAFFGVVLLFWRRPKADSENRRERFLPALRAGGRYVWHEPIVRRILLRTILFVAPAVALWALLPLVASQRLGLGADGYGALFAALGLGAILGAFVLGRVRDRLSSSGLLTVAGLLDAAGLALIVLTQSFPAALVILVLAGVAWMAMTSTLAAELQLFLPVWVRARALAVFMLTFTGSMTVGALLWGLVAEIRPAADIPHRSSRRTGRRRRGSVPARAGDRSPRPRAGRLLAGGATGLRP